jgi:hypothetical protein
MVFIPKSLAGIMSREMLSPMKHIFSVTALHLMMAILKISGLGLQHPT